MWTSVHSDLTEMKAGICVSIDQKGDPLSRAVLTMLTAFAGLV
jgi:hypothetical protein